MKVHVGTVTSKDHRRGMTPPCQLPVVRIPSSLSGQLGLSEPTPWSDPRPAHDSLTRPPTRSRLPDWTPWRLPDRSPWLLPTPCLDIHRQLPVWMSPTPCLDVPNSLSGYPPTFSPSGYPPTPCLDIPQLPVCLSPNSLSRYPPTPCLDILQLPVWIRWVKSRDQVTWLGCQHLSFLLIKH